MEEHLGFSPDILRRLGEELVPYADQGLLELVRNAYDADAKTCTIRLQDTTMAGGSIFVSDDGIGIDRQSITNGWLVIGRSHKRRTQRTAEDRIPAGDKGLGRLAGLRLGTSALLRSRPASEPGVQYEVLLNWNEFDDARLIEDVVVKVVKSRTTAPQGTVIELRDVRAPFSRANVTRLARSLVLLSDPFDHSAGFRPILLAPEFSDLERRVSESYFDEVQYRITAAIDETGHGHAEVLDFKGQRRFQADHTRLAKRRGSQPYNSPAATFELWVFNLGAAGFATRTATKGELTEWIKVVGGVHVYQHNLRVPPYGDAGEDWLDMNLRRARSPEFRPSTNTSVGRVVVESQDDRLVQKTDRSGFLENEPFIDLRQFCRDVLDWSGTEHLRIAENKRRDDRKRAESDTKATTSDAEKVRTTLSKSQDPTAKAAFDRYQKALDRQLQALREDVLLYRTLGTVGTTSSAFAHESVKPASRIEQGVKLTRSAGIKSFGNKFNDVTGKQLDAIEKAAIALGKWAQLPLQLLRRDKRRQQRVDLRQAIRDVTDLLEPFMQDAKISLKVDFPTIELAVFAPPAALESIVANLLINSIQSVVSGPKRSREIRVVLEAVRGGRYGALVVSDSGTGIEGIDMDELWLPGRTTRDQGTGLGLTIVQDSAVDLGGSVTAIATGDLGGAQFTVELPLVDTL
jgi:Histidine kinase-, DNA gyrase B-, and HSP90-like ATPase